MELDRIPLWRGDHVSVQQLGEDFAQYLYLPRLKNTDVLLEAIAGGVSNLLWRTETFAVAEGYDEATGRYLGLKYGQEVRPMNDGQWVVVKPEAAQRQIAAELVSPLVISPSPQPTHEEGTSTAGGVDSTEDGTGGGNGEPVLPPPSPPNPFTRYWATVDVDPSAMATRPAETGREIVQHLATIVGAKVTVTLEIQAEVPSGIPEDVRRVKNENSQTLKFRQYGFEEE
jgi:hypothetical protein